MSQAAIAWAAIHKVSGEQVCILTNPESPTFKRRDEDPQIVMLPLLPPAIFLPVEVGDAVQIHPASDDRFGGCLLIVEEVREWGYIGYVSIPGKGSPKAYYRVEKANTERIGRPHWRCDIPPE